MRMGHPAMLNSIDASNSILSRFNENQCYRIQVEVSFVRTLEMPMKYLKLCFVFAVALLSLRAVPLLAQSGTTNQQGRTLTCASDDGGRHYCAADTSRGVRMVQQRSGSPCEQGQTWGYDRRGIWVDRGCRADFELGRRGWLNPGSQSGNGGTVTCSSDDGGRHYCTADTRGGVRMVQQRSGSPCEQGRTWGYDQQGIWVDRGCRADFELRRGQGFDQGSGNTITCSSDDGGRHYCSVDTRGGVRMVQQRSGSPCEQGRTWGYDRRGIWVDRGCRADFVTGR